MIEELKPCPLCKCDRSTLLKHRNNIISRICDDCDAETGYFSTEERVNKAWNTRPIEDALQARIDELQKENYWLKSQRDVDGVLIAELEAKLRWIPVSERLPEKQSYEAWEQYICKINRYGRIMVVPLYFSYGRWFGDRGVEYTDMVIDWMPLPEVSEEVNND